MPCFEKSRAFFYICAMSAKSKKTKRITDKAEGTTGATGSTTDLAKGKG